MGVKCCSSKNMGHPIPAKGWSPGNQRVSSQQQTKRSATPLKFQNSRTKRKPFSLSTMKYFTLSNFVCGVALQHAPLWLPGSKEINRLQELRPTISVPLRSYPDIFFMESRSLRRCGPLFQFILHISAPRLFLLFPASPTVQINHQPR